MLSCIICSTIYGQSLIFNVSLLSFLSPLSLLLWESYLPYEFFHTFFFVPTNNVFLYVSFKISSHSISLAHVYFSTIPFPTHLFSTLLLHLPHPLIFICSRPHLLHLHTVSTLVWLTHSGGLAAPTGVRTCGCECTDKGTVPELSSHYYYYHHYYYHYFFRYHYSFLTEIFPLDRKSVV